MALFFLDNTMEYDNRKNPIPLFLNHIFRIMDFNYQKQLKYEFLILNFIMMKILLLIIQLLLKD